MTGLINQQGGNTFFNYRTPLIPGESGSTNLVDPLLPFYQTAWGVTNVAVGFPWVFVRFPAPGLEVKTGAVTANDSSCRIRLFNANNSFINSFVNINASNQQAGAVMTQPTGGGGGTSTSPTDLLYAVANDFSISAALLDSSGGFKGFLYCGWLRERQYFGSTFPRGLVLLSNFNSTYVRYATENNTGLVTISSANNAITNPAITCSISTPGADATDVVIRDNPSPNYAIGKLYNYVSLPNSAVIGQLWKNTGVDPDGYPFSENTNKYLVVAQWGGRKLGMRIWTEGFT